jgi:hypothetical protein
MQYKYNLHNVHSFAYMGPWIVFKMTYGMIWSTDDINEKLLLSTKAGIRMMKMMNGNFVR